MNACEIYGFFCVVNVCYLGGFLEAFSALFVVLVFWAVDVHKKLSER